MIIPSVTMRELPSPNQDARPAGGRVDMLILHGTGGGTASHVLDWQCRPASRQSFHYLVALDGTVWRLVPEDRRAWHAGASSWRGNAGLDGRSVGIGVAGPGREGGPPFPALQMASLCDLCLDVLSRHPIPARNVVACDDVAPDDVSLDDVVPNDGAVLGAALDWAGLAANGVGLWPDSVSDPDAGDVVRNTPDLRSVRAMLAAVGYRVAPDGPWDASLRRVLAAFQRHWRPDAVTGEADAGTLARLRAVLRLAEADAVPA